MMEDKKDRTANNKIKPYKYLEGLIPEYSLITMFNFPEEDKVGRQERFNSQRKKYGFDERETWALDFTTITWIYSHLKMYKERSIVEMYDEDAHHYIVDVLIKNENGTYTHKDVETKELYSCIDKFGKEKTIEWIKPPFKYEKKYLPFGDIIDIILEYFEFYFNKLSEPKSYSEQVAMEGLRLYNNIILSLWW